MPDCPGVPHHHRPVQESLLGRVALVSMAANVLLILLLIGSLLRLLMHLSSLRQDHVVSSSGAQHRLGDLLRSLAYACFAIGCLLSAARRDADVFVFALALFTMTADAEAEAVATMTAISPRALAARLPDVGDSAEARLRAARLRQLPCLSPEAHRRSGGLVSVLLVVALTSVTDLLWGLSPQVLPLSKGLFLRRVEDSLVVVKLLLKLIFLVTGTRLRFLRPVSKVRSRDTQTARPPTGGGPLFATSVALLFLACVSSTMLTEAADRSAVEAEGGMKPSLSDDVAGLATGPAGMLAVLGSTVSLRSGGIFSAALLGAGTFVALLVDGVWICFGPPALGIAEVGAFLDGNVSETWVALSPVLRADTIMLLLQMPLLLCICVAALYHWLALLPQSKD